MNTQVRLAAATAFAALVLAGPAQASPVTFELNDLLSGVAPTSSDTWLSLTFTDTGIGAVRLAVQSGLETTSELISDLVFNIGGGIDPLAVAFTENAALRQGTFQDPTITRDLNDVGLPPQLSFDFGLAFLTTNSDGGAKRFNLADLLVYDLTCNIATDSDCALFNATSFNATNQGGTWFALAHFQGSPVGAGTGKFGDNTADDNTAADDVPGVNAVPEPAALLLLGSGIAAVAGQVRRRRRANQA